MKMYLVPILSFFFAAASAFPQSSGSAPGQSRWGAQHFVEYVAGDLPVIISVPHGGSLKPELVADRTFGVNVKDNGTQEIAREMIAEFRARTGKYPHVIFSHLARKKLDVNREEFEGAQDNPVALAAWNEYHGFIDSANAAAVTAFGRGFLIDLHGQNNPEERIEIGYRLENDDLQMPDGDLNSKASVEKSTLKHLMNYSALSHAELIRGANSLGALFDRCSVPSTPSPSQPAPGSYKFFSGGYTVGRHTVDDTSSVFGVQFELNTELRRPARSHSTAVMLVAVIIDYLTIQWGPDFWNR